MFGRKKEKRDPKKLREAWSNVVQAMKQQEEAFFTKNWTPMEMRLEAKRLQRELERRNVAAGNGHVQRIAARVRAK